MSFRRPLGRCPSSQLRSGRSLRPGRAAVLACLLLAGGTVSARAQNFSGLQGEELRLSGDLESGIESIVTGLLSGSKGRIEKVVVTDDRERRLAVRVTYRELRDRRLVGELKGKRGERQGEFERASVVLEAESGEVELVFDPRPDPPAGSGKDSGFLFLRVLRSDGLVPEQQLSFRLGKRWQLDAADSGEGWEAGEGGESVVVKVAARPAGKAAELREDGAVVLPPVRIPVKELATVRSPETRGAVLAPRTRAARSAAVLGAAEATPATRAATRVTPEQRRVMTKTAPVVEKLPARGILLRAEVFQYGLGNDITSKQGKGPGSATFELLEGLRAEPGLPIEAITRISRRIFQDQNPASGIFYFLPEAYYVGWDPDTGYGLRMLYSAATAPGEAGEVMMAAQLDSGVDTSEIQLAEALLRAYHARNTSVAFTEVRQLPLDQAPEVSLAGDLQHQYDIAAEKTSVSAFSDVLGEIQVSWVTDTVTKENMQLALVEDLGINGAALLTPSGGGLGAQQIPVRIKLADVGTLGPVFWRREDVWRNQMSYPVRLRYLHALLLENNLPIVYTWDLGGATVPPRARVELDASRVPRWLDQRALRMWIDYVPIASCEPCDQAVVSAITGGVTSLGAAQISFHTITPLADTGAYEISVTLRSRYFDPKTRDRRTLPPLVLGADNQDFTLGPIYLVNRQPGEKVPGDPLFEYSIEVAMGDGTTYSGTTWIPADGLRVLIGRVQLEQALGRALPEAAAPDASQPEPDPQ